MLSETLQKAIRRYKLVATLIWTVFSLLPFILLFVLSVQQPQNAPHIQEVPVVVWIVLSLVAAAMSLGVPAVILAKGRIEGVRKESESTIRQKLSLSPSPLMKLDGLSSSEIRVVYLVLLYQTATIVRLTCGEIISIFGFVHGLQVQSVSAYVPFMAATLILNILAFPRVDEYVRTLPLEIA